MEIKMLLEHNYYHETAISFTKFRNDSKFYEIYPYEPAIQNTTTILWAETVLPFSTGVTDRSISPVIFNDKITYNDLTVVNSNNNEKLCSNEVCLKTFGNPPKSEESSPNDFERNFLNERLWSNETGKLLCPLCTNCTWQQHDNDLWRLEKWLETAEGIQATLTVPPSDFEQLEDAVQDNHEFTLNLKSHHCLIISLNSIGDHLTEHSEDKSRADELRRRLEITNERWKIVCLNAAQWHRALQISVMNNNQFHDTIEELNNCLEQYETSIRSQEPVEISATNDELEHKFKKFKELRGELERIEPRVVSLKEISDYILKDHSEQQNAISSTSVLYQTNARDSLLPSNLIETQNDLVSNRTTSTIKSGAISREALLILETLSNLKLRLQSLRGLTGVYILKLGAVLGRDSSEIGINLPSTSSLGSSLHTLSLDLLDQASITGRQTPASMSSRNLSGDHDLDQIDENDQDQYHHQQISTIRRSYRFLGRVVRASLPIQVFMLVILGFATLVPSNENDYSCMLTNNFARSLQPMIRYNDGPPPV